MKKRKKNFKTLNEVLTKTDVIKGPGKFVRKKGKGLK